MIHIEDLHKQFGSETAVENVSFTVKRGEVLGFLGPNGAGKTTTMRMLTGFLSPTSGAIRIDNQDVRTHPIQARKKIGYLPENNPLYDSMRVYEYLEFIAGVKHIQDAQADIQHVVNTCDLQEKVASSIADLSKGYRQRVGLAAALLGDPEVLILDEPTSGLDPNQAVSVRKLIRDIGETKTIIFSTHILQEVQESCDRALIIHRGKVVASGTVEELLQSAAGHKQVHIVIDAPEEEKPEEHLQHIQGVEEVQSLGNGKYTVRVESGHDGDIRRDIFQHCVDASWTLLEMHQSTKSLEDVFRQLTAESPL